MNTGHNVILDTSALIDFEQLDGRRVAQHVDCDYADLRPGITSITLAELAAGPHATTDPAAHSLPVITRNPHDFAGLEKHVTIVPA